MQSAALTPERYVAAAAVVATAVLVVPSALDPVNIVKLTALLICALALIVLAAARLLRSRVLHVPVSAAGVAAAGLLIGLAVSAAVAPVLSTAVLGAYGRNSGLLAYLAAVVLFVVALRVFDRAGARVLLGGVVLAGLFTASYGLLQRAGWDVLDWNNPFNPIIASLGNPNFASGYLGISASTAAGGALYAGWPRGWRITSGITALLGLVAATLSASVQGPIAATAGLGVVAAGWLSNLDSRPRRVGLGVLGVGVLSGAGVLVTGLVTGTGPAAAIFADAGSRARGYYWEAAWTMFLERPVLGVGLDHYGSFWRSSRSTESLSVLPGTDYSDAAHSVPLQMLAQGGVLLGAAYLALVLVTATALLRGLVRLRGDDRALLAAVGGGWAAYQVQSFVSIDQVPLIVLHFSLAGAVIAVAGAAGLRRYELPGAPVPRTVLASEVRTQRRLSLTPQQRELSPVDWALVAAVGAVALFAAYQSLAPLRASIAVKSADARLAVGDGDGTLAGYEQALELVPGQPRYWMRKAALFEQAVPPLPDRARTAYQSAVDADPHDVSALRELARATEATGDVERSRALHRRAVRLDPLNEATALASAEFELRHGGASAAREVLVEATQRIPAPAQVWAQLGLISEQLGDRAVARSAYERALEIEPGQPQATEGLAQLPD